MAVAGGVFPKRVKTMKTGELEIRTERLLLRPHRLEDVDDILEFATDPDWGRYLWAVPMPYRREHAVEFVARRILADWDERPLWAVVLEGKVVGAVGLEIDVADVRNAPSLRVLEKLGMTREGMLRSHFLVRDERIDAVCHGVLREEWK